MDPRTVAVLMEAEESRKALLRALLKERFGDPSAERVPTPAERIGYRRGAAEERASTPVTLCP